MSKRMIVAALALAGIFVAIYLLLYKLGIIGELSCSVGSCETVNTSKWATFLGLPVAAWGVGWYVAMFGLALAGTREEVEGSRRFSGYMLSFAAGGLLFSTWLTYLELFVIHAICQWCVISAIIVAAIFVISLADLRDTSATS